MRPFWIFFVLFILFSLVQGKIESLNNFQHPLSKATGDLIENVIKDSEIQNVRIIMLMSNESSLENVDIGNEIVKVATTKFKIQTRGNLRQPIDREKRISPVILMVDSIGTFNLSKLRIEHDTPKFYLVILTKGIFKEIIEILDFFWKNSVSDVNFLVLNQTVVEMYTFFPFANKKCGTDLSLVLINTFDLTTCTWSGNQFFPSKIKNLHKCQIKVGVSVNVPMVIFNNKTTQKYDGIEVTLIREIAKEFDFVPQFTKPYESVGAINSNGSSSGLISEVYKRKLDVAIGSLSLQIDRTNYLSATTSFATVPIVIVIPPTPQISPFAKLYLPFDFTTWSLLLAMFLIGYIVIIVTKLFAKTLYKLIVGKNVNYPFTNMFIAFFGLSQNVLPKANFSRFLLAKFLIFCLVIRGLYQGKLFDIMQKDIHEKESKTIEDLVSKNFIFYTYESLSRRVQGQSFVHKVKVIKNSQLEEYRHKTLDSSFNGVVFNYEYQVVYLNFLNKKDYSYLILKERFVTNQMVFYLQENHFLKDAMSEKINWFRDFGILHKIILEYVDNFFLNKLPPEKAAKSLKFQELSAIFGLWLAGLGFSFIVCLVEVGIGYKKPIKNRKKTKVVKLIKTDSNLHE
ncbi:hypothetical protein PVAND_000989 [Polypedilum vanderplanki]|uniref:Ionotropic receptor n=1 Tax=Polypedilum vanderplanki TaxID=319348 RepID=A0A9J6BLK7_POLVA|nr:hypothetical protein PVAND_000989 [Polypedilum vanderplanki]